MAYFEIVEGAPGQGKSLYTARKIIELFKRNLKWYKATGVIRPIYSNLRLASFVEEYMGFGTENSYLYYWSDSQEVCKLKHCDLVWDEIATELDNRNFANLTVELKRFLSQYRKRGVDIYANTQDFSMIDARARLMITGVKNLKKIMGSRDISTTKPKPKYIWGLILIRTVQNWKETDPEKKEFDLLPDFFLIEKQLVDLYDTTQDVPMGKPAPLKHVELMCEFHGIVGHDCNFKKIVHQ